MCLDPRILDALRRLRSRQALAIGLEHVRGGLLGVDEIGDPIRPEWYSDQWRMLCKRAGVPEVTLHAARHTSVSLMRDLRLPDHDIAQWHGHDEAIMRRTYSHSSRDGLRTAGTAFFDAIEAATETQ